MIDLQQLNRARLQREPYGWAMVGDLFSPHDAARLVVTFPRDHFKVVDGYEVRALIGMDAVAVSNREHLSESWRELADVLLTPAYRDAVSALSGVNLSGAPLEVNVFHYGAGASLDPHTDSPDKIVTHSLFFNDSWRVEDGGCLTIQRTQDAASAVSVIPPVVGNSAVIVRSDNSWHAVSPVVPGCTLSRRSLTATFYRPGSRSSLWPIGDRTPVRDYVG